MTRTTILLAVFFSVFVFQGCYSSSSSDVDAREDAREDRVDTESADVVEDDAAPDVHPDVRPDLVPDVEPDVEPDGDAPPARYRLHEWGVMIMDDMDGDGASTHGPSPAYAGPIPAKPVLYFYADEVIDPVDIRVSFASGASTEVWPEIPLGPEVAWSGLTVTPGDCETTPFPSMYDDDPLEAGLCEACALASCVVEDAACLRFGDTLSKLLFYTGRLPEYEAPLRADVSIIPTPIPEDMPQISLGISNVSDHLVKDVWFIYRFTGDSCIDPSACPVVWADIAFTHVDEIPVGMGMITTLPVIHVEAEVDEYGYPIGDLELPEAWQDMPKDLLVRLVERGLTEAEAGAFMRNWETIFFGLMGSDAGFIEPFYSSGASLVYFMSREEYDAQLPLAAVPPPAETVRVGMVYQHIPLYYPD